MIKAVIFDFDYTLGDSTMGIVLSVNYGLEKLGHSQKDVETIRKTIGMSLRDTYFSLTGSKNEEEAQEFARLFKKKADEVMVVNTSLYAGVQEVLEKLKSKGLKTGIVTTKYHFRIEQILNKFQANHLIDFIVGADDVKIEKPNPEGLLWVVKQLELKKEEVLYVGDSLIDARTAGNADISFAGVLTGTTTRADFEKMNCAYVGNGIADVYNYFFDEDKKE